MEYQKITNLLDNASYQPSKFRKTNWVETIDESREGYNGNNQIKFNATMLKPSLCGYSDAYILIKRTITMADTSAAGAAANKTNKNVIFKKCTLFSNCVSEINNTQVGNSNANV